MSSLNYKITNNKTKNNDNNSCYNNYSFLKLLNIEENNKGCFNGFMWTGSEHGQKSVNPSTNQEIAYTSFTTEAEYEETIKNMTNIKQKWMHYPMVKRGEIIGEIGDEIKKYKLPLGKLLALEVGKIEKEGIGEVQEVIDICYYAQGLSRTLNGKIYSSERSDHIIHENWNPLGLIGVISAFNFPFAVLGWNAAIGMICGNLILWKGHEATSLIHVAVTKIITNVLDKHGFNGVFTLVSGRGNKIGEKIINDKRLSLISFTGSTKVGQHVSKTVHERFGRTILELGGNNCSIVMDDADLDVALPQVVFGSVGTCGQRCTTIRRLLIHEKLYDEFIKRMITVYKSVKIGDPLDDETFLGPINNKRAIEEYISGIETAKQQGGKLLYGGRKCNYDEINSKNNKNLENGNFILPTIIEIDIKNAPICKTEIFAPILYVSKITNFEEAVEINNSVPQGLSSSIFTYDMTKILKWTGPLGSDCGLVNVNLSTSGAEIGGAFGGEKETGGGRESGGDCWRQYMRQTTSAINYGKTVQLAQGIKFPKF